jgi:hypothetical protein
MTKARQDVARSLHVDARRGRGVTAIALGLKESESPDINHAGFMN